MAKLTIFESVSRSQSFCGPDGGLPLIEFKEHILATGDEKVIAHLKAIMKAGGARIKLQDPKIAENAALTQDPGATPLEDGIDADTQKALDLVKDAKNGVTDAKKTSVRTAIGLLMDTFNVVGVKRLSANVKSVDVIQGAALQLIGVLVDSGAIKE